MKMIHKYKGIARINQISLRLFTYGFLLSIFSYSCEEFVDIDPPITEVVSETVYSSNGTAISAIRGIYIEMMTGNFASGNQSSVTNLSSLSSDDVLNFSITTDRAEFNSNTLTANNSSIANLWNEAYNLIYLANSILEGLENSSGITQAIKSQLKGEAIFIRAFIHLYLENLFGDVPIIGSTDFMVNNLVSRDPASDVLQQVIADLLEAQGLLANDYSFSNDERVQPNHSAATALLARAYLYSEDWVNAEIEASKVINNTDLYILENDLNDVFLANSFEAIWQLKPVTPGRNTNEAQIFINVDFPSFQVLTDAVVNSFEPGDNRRLNWVDSLVSDEITYYHPFKYKIWERNQPLTEYSMVLRLAEQYLIRAESRARQNNISGAQADLNAIRNRAGLPNTPANDQASLLLAIEKEKRLELFTEWGHRWFDLKRTGRAETVLSPLVLKDWQSTDVLYPIPQNERAINSRLTQNDGY